MNNFVWQEGFSLGVAAIDDDHRAVFDLVRRIVGLEPAPQSLDQMLLALRHLLEEHVAREERLMHECGHPEVATLERHHAEQLRPLFTVMAMIARRGRITDDTAAYLRTWCLHHIICHDLRLRDFLREKQACDTPLAPPRRSWITRLTGRLDVLPLRWRILLIAVLPLLAVLVAAAFGIAERLGRVNQMADLYAETVLSTKAGHLVHELQRERGLTALGGKNGRAGIEAQRAGTDEALRQLEAQARLVGTIEPASLPELRDLRDQIDRGLAPVDLAAARYSQAIAELLNLVQLTVAQGAAPELANDAWAYAMLMRGKERAGIERATGVTELSDGAPDGLRRLYQLSIEQGVLEQEFMTVTNGAAADRYRAILAAPSAQATALRDRIVAALDDGRPLDVTPDQWFTVMSARIDAMKRIEDLIAGHILGQAEMLHREAWRQIGWVVGGALVLLAAALVPVVLLGATVVPPLAALHRATRSLAAGNHAVDIPGIDLRDEIGAMARTVQSFREGLINRDLLSLQARLEVSSLVRGIADNVPGILFQHAKAPDGRLLCTYVSEKVQHYTGKAPDAIVGRANEGLIVQIHPEDRDRVSKQVAAAVAEAVPIHADFRVRLPTGAWAWLRLVMAPRQTTEGATVWDGLALDVSELKDAEAQRTAATARLAQLYKLQALTQLAGGMAHEINNLLQPIIGLSELALMELPPDTRVRSFIENVLLAGQQARDLVAKITSFSRIEPLERELVNVADAVDETVAILQGILPRTLTLRTETTADRDIAVLANAGELKQILMNLCTNAVHAIGPRSGTVTIGIRRVEQTNGSLWAELSVSDTGAGIDEAIIDRIFDPFFTTKEVGQGTGLGLALVNSLVAGFGGHIDVSSQPQQGTTFTVRLPLQPMLAA